MFIVIAKSYLVGCWIGRLAEALTLNKMQSPPQPPTRLINSRRLMRAAKGQSGASVSVQTQHLEDVRDQSDEKMFGLPMSHVGQKAVKLSPSKCFPLHPQQATRSPTLRPCG
jgi:hypothetical protein